jgi:hypothetical protein
MTCDSTSLQFGERRMLTGKIMVDTKFDEYESDAYYTVGNLPGRIYFPMV